jgi:hypothetical protein
VCCMVLFFSSKPRIRCPPDVFLRLLSLEFVPVHRCRLSLVAPRHGSRVFLLLQEPAEGFEIHLKGQCLLHEPCRVSVHSLPEGMRDVVGVLLETLVLQVENVCATERARALLVSLLELERAFPAEAAVVARFQRTVGPFGEADAASVGLGDIVRIVQSVKDLKVVAGGGGFGWHREALIDAWVGRGLNTGAKEWCNSKLIHTCFIRVSTHKWKHHAHGQHFRKTGASPSIRRTSI